MLMTQLNILVDLVRTNMRHYEAVRRVFDPKDRHTMTLEALKALPSASSRTLAQRLQRTGKLQYNNLAQNDPRRMVADQWIWILDNAETLLNPAPNSDGASIKEQLDQLSNRVEQQVAVANRIIGGAHPDSPGGRAITGSRLVNVQPIPGRSTHSSCSSMTATMT